MDFIERWFRLSPDGGNGMLEWLMVAVGALSVSALLMVRDRLARAFWWYVEELGQQAIRDPERVHYFEKPSPIPPG